jgi:DNA polymerase-3 subunit chi
MTRIDFYQLKSGKHNSEQLVCQLCQKAWQAEQSVLVLSKNEQQCNQLDRLLWTFSDDSFVPHDCEDDTEFFTPILIKADASPQEDRQLLINLSADIPEYFAQFERVIELVTETNTKTARQHYSYYQERGYSLNHHTI